MALAGYSGTPLFKKLGIKPGQIIMLIHEPPGYYDWLGTPIDSQLCRPGEIPDLVHVFVKNNRELVSEMKKLKRLYEKKRSLIIWISWYKKAAGIPTDITEDNIRNHALKNDLVDIKVCAVSEQWSGLKLVVPLAKR